MVCRLTQPAVDVKKRIAIRCWAALRTTTANRGRTTSASKRYMLALVLLVIILIKLSWGKIRTVVPNTGCRSWPSPLCRPPFLCAPNLAHRAGGTASRSVRCPVARQSGLNYQSSAPSSSLLHGGSLGQLATCTKTAQGCSHIVGRCVI